MIELEHGSGGWLKEKSREHLVKTLLYVIGFVILLLISTPRLPTDIVPSDFDNSVTLFALLPFVGAYVNLREYLDCKRGMQGENRVRQLLDSEFGARYYIINDLEYVYDENKNRKANIDHIVLGPNGIFVIETKATSGEITYKKDFWYPPFRRSPSTQVGYNCSWVKKTIDDADVLNFTVWVEPIIVFPDKKAKLTVIDPEIEAVVELKDLPDAIRSFGKYAFSPEQLERVGQAIIKKASGMTRH